MKISFFVNETKKAAKEVADRLSRLAASLGVFISDAQEADVIVTLGGDGTILTAVHSHPGKPLLGLNLGGLGFMASVEEKGFAQAIEFLARGRYKVSRRTMISVRDEQTSAQYNALNDVVIKSTAGHASVVDLSVDGATATRYHSDGLVISSPTGSTAYSLSAGGPVLMPDSRSIVITPVCPHALGIRSLVVRDDCQIKVVNRRRSVVDARKVVVCVDGQEKFSLSPDCSVSVGKSQTYANFVELEGHDPYEILSRKLGWRGNNLNEGDC